MKNKVREVRREPWDGEQGVECARRGVGRGEGQGPLQVRLFELILQHQAGSLPARPICEKRTQRVAPEAGKESLGCADGLSLRNQHLRPVTHLGMQSKFILAP